MKVIFPHKNDRVFGGSLKPYQRNSRNRLSFYWAITVSINENSLWFQEKDNQWKDVVEAGSCTHIVKHWSVKSALRHIRNHSEIPKGSVIRLCSWIPGYSVKIIK